MSIGIRIYTFLFPFMKIPLSLAILAILLFGNLAMAQPSNDNIASAIDINSLINSCSGDAAYTTLNATPDLNAGTCWADGPNANVWFRFTATSTGTMQINLDRGDTKGDLRFAYMALWAADGVTQISCSSNANVDDDISILATTLTDGAIYYISVDRQYTTVDDTFSLCLSDTPTNDYLEGATNIDSFMNGCSSDAAFSTLSATADRNGGSCWPNIVGPGPYRNVWFEVTAPASGTIEVKLNTSNTKGTLQTSMLALWQADGTTEVACNSYRGAGYDYDDISLLATGLAPGTYYISVDNTYIHAPDEFTLCLSDQPTNDYYEGATDVTSLIGTCSADEAYSTLGNTFDRNAGSCWAPDLDAKRNTWFRFVAPPSGRIQIDLDSGFAQGTLRHAYMSLWSTDGNTELACATYTDPVDDLRIRHWSLTPGTTYYISVDNRYITTTDTFALCLDALNGPDTDGDGIGDAVDLDDDNDGIYDRSEACENTDLSGTVGLGNQITDATYPIAGTDITYLVNKTGGTSIYAFDTGLNGLGIRIDGQAGETGSLTSSYSTPIENVFFKMTDFDNETQMTIEVYDENNVLYDLDSEGIAFVGSIITQTGNSFTASTSNSDGDDPAGDATGAIYFYFEQTVSRVVLTYTHVVNSSTRFIQPTYCIADFDNDGIKNHKDLDSDNDGIPDNIEGQTTIGYIVPNADDAATYRSNNGVNSAYLGGLTPPNTDGAQQNDTVDTDADGDGINDTAEANITLLNNDTDNDGLDSATDTTNDYSDVGGTIDNPLAAPIILPDANNDATTGGDLDYRDATAGDYDNDGIFDDTDVDDDNDGILDTVEGSSDADGDGIIDSFDADSDNDGCPDAIEAGHTDSDSDGYLGTSPVTVDANGQVTGQGGYTGVTGNEIIATELTLNSPLADQTVNDKTSTSFAIDVISTSTISFNAGVPDYSGPGSSTSFAPLRYQWQVNGVDIVPDNTYHTGNARILQIYDVTGLSGNVYTVNVTNVNNQCITFSDSATLTTINQCDPAVNGLPDTDGDGVSDNCDLDDDNDGIPDIHEQGQLYECSETFIVDGPQTINTHTTTQVNTTSADGITYDFSTDNGVLLDTSVPPAHTNTAAGRYNTPEFNGNNQTYIQVGLLTDRNAGQQATLTIDFPNPVKNPTIRFSQLKDNAGVSSPSTYAIFYDLITPSGILERINGDGDFYVSGNRIGATMNFPNMNAVGTVKIHGIYTQLVFNVGHITNNNDDGLITTLLNLGYYDCIDTGYFAADDTDSDGINNSLDLDSDNDGMYDTTEAGHNQPFTLGRLNGGVGYYGIPAAVKLLPDYSSINFDIAESTDDSEFIPDFLDLDSDGDGIPDNIEAQTTLGYILPDAAYNSDGLDTAYLSGLVPTNTDGSDNPDYLDLNSDNEGSNDTTEANISLIGNDSDSDGLDDATDATGDYTDVGGTIDNPLAAPVILPDSNNDAATGGDVDFRDVIGPDNDNDGIDDITDLDDDNDGIPDGIDGCRDTDISGTIGIGNNVGNATYNLEGTDLTYTLNNPDNTEIIGYDAGLQGMAIRMGGLAGNTGSLTSTYSNPIALVSFKLTDFDNDTQTTVEVYDENNVLYDLTVEGVAALGSGITQTGNLFVADSGDLDGDDPADDPITSILFYFARPVSRIVLNFEYPSSSSTRFTQPIFCSLDSDGDGVINIFDLDSDNDGIYDAVEASHSQPHTNGVVDGIAGIDGIPNIVQNPVDDGNINYSVAESVDDFDAIYDFLDLDSDGDGIPDNIEAQTTLGYVLSNTDNAATYLANDGVNSAYLGGLTPTNTDGADNPDYLDLDSDNEGGNDTSEANITLTNNDTDNDGLDDATDATGDYSDVGGTIDYPLTAPVVLPDLDNDASSGGDVDFRDPTDDRTDSDNDGVSDAIDLDDDNDGILDTVEGSGNFDGDALVNSLDLDSDGDGIPDNVEGQTTIGYTAPNADNAATYLTNNGVNSAYLGGLTPTNTDTTDNPDYLDLDSDNEGGNDTLEAQITLSNSDGDNDGLDDSTDATADYSDVGGTIDDPLSGAIILLDTDRDANSGGDVDFRDAQDDRLDTDNDGISDAIDLDDDNDGLLDSEELNVIIGNTQPDCTGETILDFSTSAVLESGAALQQGAVYRFPNVSAGTDALLTIVETFNASVADIDNNASEPQAFRPRTAFDISNVGKEGYIEYHMEFVNSGGTTPVTVPKFFININDTDGNVDYSEEIYVENPTNYIISNPTDLSVTYEFPWIVATGGTTEYAGAGNTFPQANFGVNYENRSEISFRAGITTIIPAVAASGREHNLDFRCTTNYINPEIYVLDSDKDGYPNPIDLDSDNDGTFDVVEAGHGQGHTSGRIVGSVGVDGVPDSVQSDPDGGIVNYTVGESADDTDNMANFADLDSDGDGIPDNVEAQTTIGYIAPSGTVDTNGVDTAYVAGLNPTNTDGTDEPDYLDTDSDNEGHNDTRENRISLSGIDSDNDGLDDTTDEDISGYADPGGTIDDPLAAPIILPDVDSDATSGGDVDFRDATDDRPDNDNDGLPDVVDFDDDNDGILDTDEGCGNLIINGSFEQDDFADGSVYSNAGANGAYIGADLNTDQIAAWDYTQNMDAWVEGGAWAPAYHGIQYMDLIGAATRSGGIMNEFSQVINTVPGNTYTLSLHWGEDWGHAPGSAVDLQIAVLDETNTTIFNDNQSAIAQGIIGGVRGPNTWTYYENTFVATSVQSTVRFTSNAPGPNFYSGANIDFVSVTVASPSTCSDTDNDGVIDSFDLDSDNDGIFDAVEAGHGQAHTNGVVNGTTGVDGIPDAVQNDPDRETVNYTLAESTDDADIVPDFLDLDADGDGIPDNVEAQTTIGYVAPSGSVDANGVDTSYPTGIIPTNTDGADAPDYLDLDSDNEGGNDTLEAAIILTGNDVDNDGLDDATDATADYTDVGGTIDDPLSGAVILPDVDNDAATGGDVDFRDAVDDEPTDIDSDDDGILDSFEDWNLDGDNDPTTDPTNSDNDAYPDYLDIDSDDDGIPDNVEAQTTSGYIPPSLVDANNNGLDDAYENGTDLGLIPVNTDGADMPDYLDDDSDGDGVPDNIEGNDYNTDGVPDVVYIGSDKDDDGLDDNYEGIEQIDIDVNDEIDDPINDLPNTDGDAESDYRDLDDDDDGVPTMGEDPNGDMDYSNDDWDNDGIPDYLDPDIQSDEELEVYNVITPNADGIHDVLTIRSIENYPNNDIQVYNRWGVLVFETTAYHNQNNNFNGRSQARATLNKDELLPKGTYFYILNYEDRDGTWKQLAGHLYLN